MINATKEELHKQFKMNDLGNLKYFLGIEVLRSALGVILNQRKHILELISYLVLVVLSLHIHL